MSEPSIDPRLLDVLHQASSLELFQLSTLIERLLADPRRIIAVRKDMHLGQTVRFLDWRDGSLREGKVVALRDTQVTLQDLRERREWKLPCWEFSAHASRTSLLHAPGSTPHRQPPRASSLLMQRAIAA